MHHYVGFLQIGSHIWMQLVFQYPSRLYFNETIIRKIYAGMREEVLTLIHNGSTSFSTAAWSSGVNDTSLLSLTAHWINSQFKRTSAVLNAQCLTEAHTGEYIST